MKRTILAQRSLTSFPEVRYERLCRGAVTCLQATITMALKTGNGLSWRPLTTASQLLLATVIEAEQDGLVVSVRGIRGIVPLSHLLMLTREEIEGGGKQQETMAKLESRKGQTLWLKVIQVDRTQHHVILSERLAQQEARKQLSEELLEELQVGDRRYGVVRVLAEFGAFVDLGDTQGSAYVWSSSYQITTNQ